MIFLTATALIILNALNTIKKSEVPQKGEFFYLLLPATVGAMVMASSLDMIILYIGIELLGISTYVLIAMKKFAAKSAEAAFKYVVIGAISSAFLLFGMSYLYGLTGETNIYAVGQILVGNSGFETLLYIATFFVIVGLGLKIAAAPFHLWAPDVYQGAPTPITAYLAVVAKGAAFAVIFRVFAYLFFYPYLAATSQGVPYPYTDLMNDIFLGLAVIGVLAMIVGTTGALKQKNMKRLLALSGIANSGYLLIPLAVSISRFGVVGLAAEDVPNVVGITDFYFYLAVYMIMNIGAFAVLSVVSQASKTTDIKAFFGLYYRAPWTAIAMLIFLLSLAGLPISGGFFGKLFILLGAAQASAYWLVAIILATSVISYYFYFRVAKQMFMRGDSIENPVKIPVTTGIVIWLCAAATLAAGIVPNIIMTWLS
jgi:NADH-quinone oxidoreductase subunit N